MAQVSGTVIIRVNGKSIRSKEKATLELGGKERTAQYADGVLIGYSEKPIASKITATIAHTASADLDGLNNATNETAVFETDTGVKFSIRGLFSTKPPELSGGDGDCAVEFMGQPAVQL